MTICVNCKHLKKEGGNELWEWFCHSPEMARIQTKNPVTGEYMYEEKNDLGHRVFTKERFPYAHRVNTHGNCAYYEKK